MMERYIEVSMDNYCVQELKCRCNFCGFEFLDYVALNYELVCFEDERAEKYFLPTYGEYGYLYLLENLIEDWHPNIPITSSVSKKLESKLDKITPYHLSLFQKVKCPTCSSDDVSVIKRTDKKNFPIKWVKIDAHKV